MSYSVAASMSIVLAATAFCAYSECCPFLGAPIQERKLGEGTAVQSKVVARNYLI